MSVEVRMAAISQWPGQLTPADERRWAPFSSTYSSTIDVLTREVGMLGGDTVTVHLAVPQSMVRADGQLNARARAPEHPGVIVTFDTRHGSMTYATDVFYGRSPGWHQNLRAIALGLHDLRRLDRYGIGAGGQQYAGYLGSGSGSTTSREDAAQLLLEYAYRDSDVRDVKRVTVEQVLDDPEARAWAYRMAAATAHPDHQSGSHEAMVAVQAALGVLS